MAPEENTSSSGRGVLFCRRLIVVIEQTCVGTDNHGLGKREGEWSHI